MALSFGTDGVRGVAYTELTTDYVAHLGRAVAQVLGGGQWLIGRDPRESGSDLEAAFAAGLRAAGARPVFVGIVPTPALAEASHSRGLPAAMITASHNPFHDNGVKIFAAGGAKLTDAVERSIEARIAVADQGRQIEVVDGRAGSMVETITVDYQARFGDRFASGALAGLHVVLDCANGAMYEVAPLVAHALGAEVTVVHAEPNGRNINDHCGATSPASLAATVVEVGADLGLAFDGDGDRVIAVDHRGVVIDGDRLIALAALQLRDEGQLVDDTVVVTVMSNLGFHRAMAQAGIAVLATAVGDRYVLEALDAGGLSLGGEQSGHIIYRKLATTGDGLLAGMQLAHHVVQRGETLHRLAAEVMISYPQVLVNVRVAHRHPDIAKELAADVAAAEATLAGDGRVLLRPSGTEPLIRVMVEAATHEVAVEVANGLAAVVRQRFG